MDGECGFGRGGGAVCVGRETKKNDNPPPLPLPHPPPSSGGVVVRTPDGLIRCSNTLDARLATAYAQNLPAVRAALFGGGAA